VRILFVQYSGDYLAAHRLAETSGTETYFGHRYVLETLAAIAGRFGETAILCCRAPGDYDERLPSGVRVIGVGEGTAWNGRAVQAIVAEFAPTHLVILGPLTAFIRQATRLRVRTLCVFADSFELGRLRLFVRYGLIGRLLRHPTIEWFGNHGVMACRSLARLGVPERRIVPWDWPHVRRPHDLPPKTGVPAEHSIFYAGLVSERKGVRDLILAIAALKARGARVRADIAGGGEVETFRALALAEGVADQVSFLGTIPNAEVFDRMRRAALVAVTSQHAYPEGLPLTIYEALCARTPIVASDHPMFAAALNDGDSALIYRAGDHRQLAAAIERALGDDALYASLSAASAAAWEAIQLPVTWGDLVTRWLGDAPGDRGWLGDHSLASGRYAAPGERRAA
jgi:glycosyltransferase involved in cell wall biosynthesis